MFIKRICITTRMGESFLRSCGDKVLFSCILLCPVLALSIAGYVIAGQHYHTSCDNSKILKLSSWLIINSTITIVGTVFLLGFYLVASGNNTYLLHVVYTNVVYVLFMLAFNIVGTIKLVKFSDVCKIEAYSLWTIVLATIIIQYVIIAVKPFLMLGVICCGECIHCCNDSCIDDDCFEVFNP